MELTLTPTQHQIVELLDSPKTIGELSTAAGKDVSVDVGKLFDLTVINYLPGTNPAKWLRTPTGIDYLGAAE